MKYPISFYTRCLFGAAEYHLDGLRRRVPGRKPFPMIREDQSYYSDFLLAIGDACEYLAIDLAQFTRYYEGHVTSMGKLWESLAANSAVFNRSLVGEDGRRNVCANTICSFSLRYSYDTLSTILDSVSGTRDHATVCDYGCCNANISFSMLLRNKISRLVMFDFPSESANFIRYRTEKYGLESRAEWVAIDRDVNVTPGGAGQFDIVYCMDVLEHTPNPTEILMEKITPMLKVGGCLILQAPWGGGVISHLDEAIVDFYSRGGRQLLSRRYRKVRSMSPLDISGIWVKKF